MADGTVMHGDEIDIDDLPHEALLDLLKLQAEFTEEIRDALMNVLAHANHIISNYATDIPDDKSKGWAETYLYASEISMIGGPVEPCEEVTMQ